MELNFYKYQGTGNDFVVADNRDGRYNGLKATQIKKICDRKFGVGADGLIFLENEAGYDFKMKYYNADGNEGSMCGNGGRCMIHFAHHCGIHKSRYKFVAADGAHEGEIEEKNTVRLLMQDVNKVEQHRGHFILNTGSPHYILPVTNINLEDVVKKGRDIRMSNSFAADGINVNFVEHRGEDELAVRTYERGVEDETMSCGTGVTASALVNAHNDLGYNMIKVKTPGGNLHVEFKKTGPESFTNIWLIGAVANVFSGTLNT